MVTVHEGCSHAHPVGMLPAWEGGCVNVGRCDMVRLYAPVTDLSNRTCSGAAIILQADAENLFKIPFFATQSFESSPIV